jgi:hypothetical protein
MKQYDEILSKQDLSFYKMNHSGYFGNCQIWGNQKDRLLLNPVKDQKELYKKVIQYQIKS